MPVLTRTRRVVHQKAKGPVDPSVGLKVRELRSARAMTQAQLAGPHFSKGFISLLETGRTRVSLRAAQILAGRLGVDVTDLLSTADGQAQDLEFMLLRAEQELRSGDRKTAADIAATWARKASGILRARFQRLHARAMIETTRSTDAVRLLDEALRTFRSLGAKEFVARSLYDMARAHLRLDSPGEAIKFALDAEQAVERGDVIDRTLELEIHQFLASAYHLLGDPASAQARAERALAIAEDAGDPAALAKLYQSLAWTRYEEGDKEAALAYARKSAETHAGLGQFEKVAETWNTIGWLLIQRGQYGPAAAALRKAESLARAYGVVRLRPWVTLNRAALSLARGNHGKARELAQLVIREANSRLRARAALLLAQATASARQPLDDVRSAFQDAIAAHKNESAHEQARAHLAYSDALSERKQTGEALVEARKASELAGVRI